MSLRSLIRTSFWWMWIFWTMLEYTLEIKSSFLEKQYLSLVVIQANFINIASAEKGCYFCKNEEGIPKSWHFWQEHYKFWQPIRSLKRNFHSHQLSDGCYYFEKGVTFTPNCIVTFIMKDVCNLARSEYHKEIGLLSQMR